LLVITLPLEALAVATYFGEGEAQSQDQISLVLVAWVSVTLGTVYRSINFLLLCDSDLASLAT
jgi:hypothetical protein